MLLCSSGALGRAGRSGARSRRSLGSGPSINDAGAVAFFATLDAGGSGIFTGPDPTTDVVIRTGDLLFGATVTALDFFAA